jgi:hypothetical protein
MKSTYEVLPMRDSPGQTSDDMTRLWLREINVRFSDDKMPDVKIEQRITECSCFGISVCRYTTGIESDIKSLQRATSTDYRGELGPYT